MPARPLTSPRTALARAQALSADLHRLFASHRRSLASIAHGLVRMRREGLYRNLGYPSVFAYAREEHAMGPSKVSELIALSRRTEGLPLTRLALDSGRLPWTKAREVAQAATAETEGEWLAFAETATGEQLRAARQGRVRLRRRTLLFEPREAALYDRLLEEAQRSLGASSPAELVLTLLRQDSARRELSSARELPRALAPELPDRLGGEAPGESSEGPRGGRTRGGRTQGGRTRGGRTRGGRTRGAPLEGAHAAALGAPLPRASRSSEIAAHGSRDEPVAADRGTEATPARSRGGSSGDLAERSRAEVVVRPRDRHASPSPGDLPTEVGGPPLAVETGRSRTESSSMVNDRSLAEFLGEGAVQLRGEFSGEISGQVSGEFSGEISGEISGQVSGEFSGEIAASVGQDAAGRESPRSPRHERGGLEAAKARPVGELPRRRAC